ncbi:MAG: hypothetical protein P8123_06985 [bacterium]
MKKNYDDLVRQGMLKALPGIALDQAEQLVKRAKKDLRTAEKVLPDDEAVTMDLLYKALFHASNALLRLQGYRPGAVRQHEAVVEAMRRTFKKDVEHLIFAFDRLRKWRNQFGYQAVFAMSEQDLYPTMFSSLQRSFPIKKRCPAANSLLRRSGNTFCNIAGRM